MAASKTYVNPVDVVLVDKTDWTDATSVAKYFTNIGSQMTSGQVWANIATGYFKLGSAAKAAGSNAEPDIAAPFAAYRKAADKRTGKTMPDTTAKTYASVATTLTHIGFTLPYDGANVVRFFAEKGGMVGGYGSRAAAFQKIADHFKTEPTFDEIVTYVKTWKVPDTLGDDAIAAHKVVSDMINEDHTDMIAEDDGEAGLAALQADLMRAIDAFTERAKLVAPPTPKRAGKVLTPAQQKLLAKREGDSAATH